MFAHREGIELNVVSIAKFVKALQQQWNLHKLIEFIDRQLQEDIIYFNSTTVSRLFSTQAKSVAEFPTNGVTAGEILLFAFCFGGRKRYKLFIVTF